MIESDLLRCGVQAARALVADRPYENGLTDGVRRIIGADCVALNVWRNRRERSPALTLAGTPNSIPAGQLQTWHRHFADHPYFANLRATGDPRPYRTSELVPFRDFRQTALYRDLLAPYGLRHQLITTLRVTPDDLVFIGLLRRLHDFSDRESTALDRLRAVLSAALAFHAELRAIQASVRTADGSHGANPPPLSSREAQVMALVAEGYTNDQTAHRLGIASRTVRKHLAAVFGKAQVNSRAAAVAWWLRGR